MAWVSLSSSGWVSAVILSYRGNEEDEEEGDGHKINLEVEWIDY